MKKSKILYNKEIVTFVKEKTGFSKKKTRIVFSIIKKCLIDALSKGDSVILKSFGSFVVKTQKVPLFFGSSELREKKTVRFIKSKSFKLPLPKQKKCKSARNIEKKILSSSLTKRNIQCDYELKEFYLRIINHKINYLPYVWKLKISKEDYKKLKGLLSWALEEYDDCGIDYRNLLKKHADLLAIYIAEWYKREYSNLRVDENNDALRSLDLPASTNDYTIIWQYSSPAFNIDKFLYGSKKTNRIKHSLYVLGGIPLQFEFKKLRAIIFNSIACSQKNPIELSNYDLNDNELNEDQAFLVENLYLRESLLSKEGSLCLFINELKNGSYLEDFENDDDYELFVENYYNLSQRFFCKYKFNCEWIIHYKIGEEVLNRELFISLNNEYSNDNDEFYISTYRLKKWNIPLDELYEFDIL